jgi:hypothetical protein
MANRQAIHIPRWIVALVMYLLVIFLLFALKPALLFDKNGRPKDFGVGLNIGKSLFAPSFFFPVLAVICFFLSTILYIVL